VATVGFELEMSDILTADAAKIVYGNLDLWKDRWGGYHKPKLDYTRWNIQSDATLRNSDGSTCMVNYMEDGVLKSASNSIKSKDRLKWRGAELVSPIIYPGELDQRLEEASQFLEQFKSNGAIFKPEFYNSLHVHVDVSDVDCDTVRSWLPMIWLFQKSLDGFGNDWRGRKLFTPEEIDRLQKCSLEEFNELYTTLPSGRKASFNANGIRRIVDIGPKFNPDKPDTIEFRCFKSSDNINYIRACIEFCSSLVDEWKKPDGNSVSIFYELCKKVENAWVS